MPFLKIYSLMGSTAKAESDGLLKGPVPAELLAATLNSYSVPSKRRVTWETWRRRGSVWCSFLLQESTVHF